MGFSENLKRYRKQRGISQTDLAKMLKSAGSTVAMYETGEREPSYNTLKKIAQILGVSQADLLADKSPYLIDEVETFDENGGSAGPEVTITLDEKDPDIAAMLALLDDFKNRADIRKLFEIAHNSTPEEVQQAAKIMEALRKE